MRHFLLLLEGKYLSTARGMPGVCTTRALVLNPPGTTHRDCFRGLDGRFFTLSIPAGSWHAATGYRKLTQDAMRLPATALVLATRLWHELRNWDGASPLAIEAGLQLLLDAAMQPSPREQDGPMWLERAREQLHDEWRRTPDLAELAGTAGVHPVYLARAFRRPLRLLAGRVPAPLPHGARDRLAARPQHCAGGHRRDLRLRRPEPLHPCVPAPASLHARAISRAGLTRQQQVQNIQGTARRACYGSRIPEWSSPCASKQLYSPHACWQRRWWQRPPSLRHSTT
jgi:hypothetical protein